MKKILFVCLGNICRSPSAENIMNYLIQKEGLEKQISCDSAGTSNFHVGAKPDSRMYYAAKQKLGITLQGKSRQIEAFDLEHFDLILAMDKYNYNDILRLDPKGIYKDKVKLMCDFATKHPDSEVPDPYYGGTDGFNYVIDLLIDACDGLLKYLLKL